MHLQMTRGINCHLCDMRLLVTFLTIYFFILFISSKTSGDFELGRNDFELGRNDLGRNGLGAKRR